MISNDPCCCTPEVMMIALLNNSITEYIYNSCVFAYFNQPTTPCVCLPPTRDYEVGTIRDLIGDPSSNCGYCIDLHHDPNNFLDNTDVSFQVIPNNGIVDGGDRFYRMRLFNGFFAILDQIMPIARFSFTKSSQPLGGLGPLLSCDIIFKIIHMDGVVTYWDLSSSVPPIKS